MYAVLAPSGVWFIAGRGIPAHLAYVAKDGSPVSAEVINDQLLLPAKFRSIKTRTWATDAECKAAIAEASA